MSDPVKLNEIRLQITHQPELTTAEIKALSEIERMCYPPATRYSSATIRRFLRLDNSLLVRAFNAEGGPIIGFQISHLPSGQLITLDVVPEFQRMGVGSAILRCTLDEFKNCGIPYARCEISAVNKPSIRLHEKFGFVTVGTWPEYYEDGSDALVLVLLINCT